MLNGLGNFCLQFGRHFVRRGFLKQQLKAPL
jgi:hypothetical protein